MTGHSFLPCDRDFALIGRQKKKTKNLVVPGDIKYMIGASNLKSPCLITEMEQANFKDLNDISLVLLNDSKQFQVNKYVWFKMTRDDVCNVYARESHNVLRPWKTFPIFKPAVSLRESALRPLYTAPIPVQKEKKKDLQTMVKFMTNPDHISFYANLPSA